MEKIIKLEELDDALNEAYEELAESGYENHEMELQKMLDGSYLFTFIGKDIKKNELKTMT